MFLVEALRLECAFGIGRNLFLGRLRILPLWASSSLLSWVGALSCGQLSENHILLHIFHVRLV